MTRPLATCPVCGRPPATPRATYCGAQCRALMARVVVFRDLADVIVTNSPSATRGAAKHALRATLHAALHEGALPAAKVKQETGQALRRWCACCRAELPVSTGRGRPAITCAATTGRPCKEARKRAAEIHALRHHGGKALHRTATEWMAEL